MTSRLSHGETPTIELVFDCNDTRADSTPVPSPIPDEPLADSPSESGPRRSRLSIIALLFGIAATAAAGMVWLQLRDFKDNQQSTNRTLNRTITDVESELSRQIGPISGLTTISDRVKDVESDLAALERSLNQLDRQVPQFLDFDIDELFFQVDALRECVNEYMRVVADAGGGRYWFYYC